jgi:hypothetical protein
VADVAGGGMLERSHALCSRREKHAIVVVSPLSRRFNLTSKCDAQKLQSIKDCLRHIMARVDNDPAKFWKAQAQLWPQYVELPGEADRGVLDTLRNAQPSVVPTGGPPLQNPQALQLISMPRKRVFRAQPLGAFLKCYCKRRLLETKINTSFVRTLKSQPLTTFLFCFVMKNLSKVIEFLTSIELCGYCFFQGGIKRHGSVMLSRMSTGLGDLLRSCIIFDHKPHGCSSINQVKSDTYTAISWQHDHSGSPDQRFIFLSLSNTTCLYQRRTDCYKSPVVAT